MQHEQENPGQVVALPSANEFSVDLTTIQAITKAELDQQVVTAKAYPRSLTAFQRDCRSMATLSAEVAGECFYTLPARRGGDGKPISGPSVRLAEIVVSAWGNCRVGSRVLEEGRDFIVAQGIFQDMERGTVVSSEVRRRIVDSKGRRYSLDMISTTANAACSIALRNATFRGVPKALWNGIYLEARKVFAGDAKTLAARRADAIDTLTKMGATKPMIFEALGVKGIEDVGLDELVTLGGFAASIRDGEASFEDVFAPKDESAEKPATRVDAAKAALKGGPATPKYDEAKARAALSAATNLATLETDWKAITDDYVATGRPRPLELDGAFNDRREALKQAAGE
jgi:hypothetical protein